MQTDEKRDPNESTAVKIMQAKPNSAGNKTRRVAEIMKPCIRKCRIDDTLFFTPVLFTQLGTVAQSYLHMVVDTLGLGGSSEHT